VQGSIHVDAEPRSVWEIVTDPTLGGRWNPNVLEIRDFSGMPIRDGSSWVQVVKILGRPTNLTARVIECREPESGVVAFTGPGHPRVTTMVSPDGTGSQLTQIMDITVPGGLGGITIRLAGPTIEKELMEALRRQKHAAESVVQGRDSHDGT